MHGGNIEATVKFLEVQISQIATTIKGQALGKFPSDMEKNPREHCNAISLRSGREVEGPKSREVEGKENEVV